MEAINPQKIKLLKLYEMLRQHTDEDRPLSTNQLCAMLESEGITCDRRTLSEDIDTLNANGFEVLHRRTRYAKLYYIVDRQFDLAEVKILIDAIQAASFITKQKTESLTAKVANLAGSHQAAALKSNLVTFNTRKHTNEAIYYTVDALENALQKQCKASFRYFDLNERGERVFRKDGERYLVNPVGLVYHEDNYYLVTYHETHEATVNYRVDRMADVHIEDSSVAEQAIALSDELGVYTERVFKMFNGPQATVELQFDRKLIDAVHDKFGESVKIISCKRGLCKATVEVLVSPVFFGWCFQFGHNIKILSPNFVAAEMKEHAGVVARMYRK
ncbi:MAG TPA: WYL domain-containing protein [Negativicutes bacterium]|nr:WYL domain-containing protein [Negativicutes bacterium]